VSSKIQQSINLTEAGVDQNYAITYLIGSEMTDNVREVQKQIEVLNVRQKEKDRELGDMQRTLQF